MIVQNFRSVVWLGAVAGAAISCYMVSLRVASERAVLESVETRILIAKRDIRALDTELSTRGRLRQLERWNVDVLALTSPTENQFLAGESQLASLAASTSDRVEKETMPAAAPAKRPDANVVLAEYRRTEPSGESRAARDRPIVRARARAEATKPSATKPSATKPSATKPSAKRVADKTAAKKSAPTAKRAPTAKNKAPVSSVAATTPLKKVKATKAL